MNQKGTGLGLSICKKIVEQMDGKVGLESEVGVGSKFMITIYTRVIDKQMFNSEPKSMSSEAKLKYVKKIGGFNFADNFYQKFIEVDPDKSNLSVKRESFCSSVSKKANHKNSKKSDDYEILLP